MIRLLTVATALFVASAAYAQVADGTKNTPQDAASKTRASIAKSNSNPPQTGGATPQEAMPPKK
jgi:hypothetical protein